MPKNQQFPYMKYLAPWKRKPTKKMNRPYLVPCRYCKRKVPLRTIGAKSETCDNCFYHFLTQARSRFIFLIEY